MQPQTPMNTIVALVDFSDTAFKILKHAHALAKAFESHVILFHVVPEEPVAVEFGTLLEAPANDVGKAHQARLFEMRDSLARFGVKVTAQQFNGATVKDLLDESSGLGAELIIVGSHGHGPLYNMLIGSVTEEVLKRAPCPVLVVPGDTHSSPAPESSPHAAESERFFNTPAALFGDSPILSARC